MFCSFLIIFFCVCKVGGLTGIIKSNSRSSYWNEGDKDMTENIETGVISMILGFILLLGVVKVHLKLEKFSRFYCVFIFSAIIKLFSLIFVSLRRFRSLVLYFYYIFLYCMQRMA